MKKPRKAKPWTKAERAKLLASGCDPDGSGVAVAEHPRIIFDSKPLPKVLVFIQDKPYFAVGGYCGGDPMPIPLVAGEFDISIEQAEKTLTRDGEPYHAMVETWTVKPK